MADTGGMTVMQVPRRVAAGVVLLLVNGVAMVEAATDPAPPPMVPEGQRLPDVAMAGLNGADRRLSSYRGRPLVINVWASWCGPCRAEAASLERFAWSRAGQDYTVIGISTDDDRRAAERWLRQSNATLSHYIDRALVLESLLGASTLPLTVFVDGQGHVLGRVRGARAWDTEASAQLVQRAFRRAAGGRSNGR